MKSQRRVPIPYDPHLKALARELRKNGTLGEVKLWCALKGKVLGVEFHRQVPLGSYIVDFFCHEHMLAVEADGSRHTHPEIGVIDVERQTKLESAGVRFLRFSEDEVRPDEIKVAEAIRIWLEDNQS